MPVTPSYLEPCICIKRLPVSVTVLPVKSLSRKQNHADILYRKLSHTADSAGSKSELAESGQKPNMVSTGRKNWQTNLYPVIMLETV